VHYEQGHFSTEAPGGFVEAAEGGEPAGRGDAAFTRAWLAPDFPRMLYVTFQHPSPYYDASYAVDSPNTGPYGRALVEELIPAIEARFRVIAEPWARVLSGSSTGGWEALALQVFHPELFGGVSAYCPDPLDFGAFQAVDIYRETNAWRRREGSREVEIPGERDATGTVISTMRQQLVHERVLGDRGRSSEQWDAWQAAFGPLGPDGYVQPLFDPRTGAIDPGVAAYYREHSDLAHIVRARWGELGPKLAGKIRVWVGTTDSYFLDRAVRRFEAALRPLEPSWGGEVVYGPGRPHCWEGPEPLADRLREMARRMAAAAPAGANLGWAGPGRP
jgi:hypothetical protein